MSKKAKKKKQQNKKRKRWSLARDHKILARLAKKYAYEKGYGHLADDFSQEFLIAFWQKKKCTLAQLFVDFIRQEYGRTGIYGTPGSVAKSHALHTMKSLDENWH